MSPSEIAVENDDPRAIPPHVIASWRELGLWSDQPLGPLMLAQAQKTPDAVFTVASATRPSRTTLRDFAHMALAGAAGLRGLGLGAGDVIAVQSPNWLETAVAHAAIALLGAVTVPVIHTFGPRELSFVCEQAKVRAILTAGWWNGVDYAAPIAAIAGEVGIRHHLVIGDSDVPGVERWDQMIEGPAPESWDVSVSPDALAVLVYTSGTTSLPKGVCHSHRSIIAEQRSEPDAGTKLSPWPPGHIAGYVNNLRFWLAGWPTVVMDRWDAFEAVRLIEELQVRASSGTPTHLAALLDAADATGRDISSLRDYLAGATPIPPDLIRRCDAHGLATYRCFGMSEEPTITRGKPEDSLELRTRTDGRPCPGTELRIVDDQDQDLPPGAMGEILIRGPERFSGYLDEALNADCFVAGGWFRTGDIGRIDADGNLAITDRKKDVIIRGGETISSREIEEALLALDEVEEAAVVGMRDARLGERICAFVRLRAGVTLDLEQVGAFFSARGISRFKTPERLIAVDEFAKTPSSKIRKQDLKDRLAAEAASNREDA